MEEFPYTGTIKRSGSGDFGSEEDITVYEGKMDVGLSSDEIGSTAQTSSYNIFIPFAKGAMMPHKDDNIQVIMEGETILLKVDNAIPSQLGRVRIYATRESY